MKTLFLTVVVSVASVVGTYLYLNQNPDTFENVDELIGSKRRELKKKLKMIGEAVNKFAARK